MGETKREIGEKEKIQGVTGVTEVTVVEYDIFWLWLPRLPRLPNVCLFSEIVLYIEV